MEEETLAKLVRKFIVWFGFAVAVRGDPPGISVSRKIFGLFPTGYNLVMGPIVYHTHFAVFIETILPIALFLALSEVRNSFTFLGVSAVLLTAVVVSASRGGLIIGCAEIFSYWCCRISGNPWLAGKSVRWHWPWWVDSRSDVDCGFGTISERFYSEALTAGRLQFAISTLHMIAVHPWIGWGLGCWPAVYPAFATFDPGAIVNQAHCDWLQWTAEGACRSGFSMLSLALWGVRPAIRSIWGIGMIAVLIHAAFDYPFSRPALARGQF